MALLRYAKFLPLVAVFIPSMTIIICLIINRAEDRYVGGLTVPYISDAGTAKPEYYIFATGLSLSGILLASITTLNPLILRRRDFPIANKHAVRCIDSVAIFGIFLGISLCMFSILDTNNFPDPHFYAAIIFFICDLLIAVLSTVGYTLIWREETDDKYNKISAFYKIILTSLILICFIIYIPVGLSIICAWEYDEDTGYDYTGCITENHIRSVSQYLCVFFSLIFFGGFYFDFARSDLKFGDNPVVEMGSLQ